MEKQVEKFWARIAMLREGKGLTVAQLAELADVSCANLRTSASRNRAISMFDAKALADVLGSTLDFLVSGNVPGSALSEDAIDIAMQYMRLSDEDQEHVKQTLEILTRKAN